MRRYRVLTYRDVGLTLNTRVPDRTVVRHAREHGAIIVSRNRYDFCTEMQRAAKDSDAYVCRQGFGLVLVSEGLEAFHFERVTKELALDNPPGTSAYAWTRIPNQATYLPRCANSVTTRVVNVNRTRRKNVSPSVTRD